MKYMAIAIVLAGVSFFALVRWIIPALVFHPARELFATPSDAGLAYEDVRLQTPDGETVAAWYIPAPDASGHDKDREQYPGRNLTLLFFHGNAGNISHRVESVAFFHRLGLSVFIMDYRGFGESTGKPSVGGTVRDARAAWQWLAEQKRVAPSDVIVFGRSLGGGVAAALVKDVTPGGLILESTFTSLHDVGKDMFRWLPGFLFLEDYATISNLDNLDVPLLAVHSPDDEMISFRMGREIFDRYGGPKTFLQISGSHNDGWFSDITVYEAGVRNFLEKLQSEKF